MRSEAPGETGTRFRQGRPPLSITSLRRSRSHRGSRPWNPSPAEPGARGILPLDRESGTTVRRNLSAWTPRIHASSRYVVFVIYRLCREMRAEPVIRRRTWHCAPIPPGSFPRSSGRPFPPRFHSSISSMRWRNRSFTVTCRSGSNSAPDALRTYPQRADRAVQPAREALLPPHRRPLRGRRHGALRLPRHRHLGPDDASRPSNEITVFELSPAPAGTRIMIRSGGRHFVGVHFQVQGLSAWGRGVFDWMGGGNRDGHSPPEPPAPLAGPPARQPPR